MVTGQGGLVGLGQNSMAVGCVQVCVSRGGRTSEMEMRPEVKCMILEIKFCRQERSVCLLMLEYDVHGHSHNLVCGLLLGECQLRRSSVRRCRKIRLGLAPGTRVVGKPPRALAALLFEGHGSTSRRGKDRPCQFGLLQSGQTNGTHHGRKFPSESITHIIGDC